MLVACASLVPRQKAVICGLILRLIVHMHTEFKNGILHNGQQLWCDERACRGFSLTTEDAKFCGPAH